MDAAEYRELITRFAHRHPDIQELEFIREDEEGIRIETITENGMVNYIYKVMSATDDQSIIIKYGKETMRLDPSEKVSLKRQELEYNSLCLLSSIDPECVPKVYCLDKTLNIIAMEDLSSMNLLGSQLRVGNVNLGAARNLGLLLGKIHRCTSREVASEEEWQTWTQQFRNSDDVEYYIDYMLYRIFDEKDHINLIAAHVLPTYRKCVEKIKTNSVPEKLRNLFQQDQCFIHGDCHFMAVFVRDVKVKIFDFEFAYLSHPGQNVAMALASYPLCNMEAILKADLDAEENTEKSKQATYNLVEAYLDENSNVKADVFLPELAIFCGAAIFFFTNFFVVDEFVILTEDQKIYLLHMATNLMISHRDITDIKTLVLHLFPPRKSDVKQYTGTCLPQTSSTCADQKMTN